MTQRIVATIGLALTVIGAALLYVSSQTKGPGWAAWQGGPDDPATRAAVKQARRYTSKAQMGFALIAVGSILQIIGVWLPT